MHRTKDIRVIICFSHNEFLNTGGTWTWNTISFVPAVGLNIFKQTSSGISQTSVLPYIRLYSDWWGKGKMKGTTVQLTLTMRNISPSLNEITESETYLDPWLISAGNPKLKDYWITSGKLSFAYFSPNNKNQIVFMVQPSYANNKIATTLPILRYNENKDWKPLQHMARLTATYTFSVGKSRRHDGKILIESSKDNTGLGKFNTPQISK